MTGGEEPIDLGPVDKLPEGEPVRVTVKVPRRRDAWTAFTDVTLGAVWLVRDGQKVRALSTVCPHAGCAVDWQKEQSCFSCPCHDSAFRPDGERVSGPSPRGMDPLEAVVVEVHALGPSGEDTRRVGGRAAVAGQDQGRHGWTLPRQRERTLTP